MDTGKRLLMLFLVLPVWLLACATTNGVEEAAVDDDGVEIEVAEGDIDVDEEVFYEAFPPGAPQRCINMRQVRRMEPVGNHTLLFYMRNGDVWRNRLPRACPGMNRRTKFLLDQRSMSLCRLDTAWQIEDHGFGFRRGAACGLGDFDFLTEDQAEALKDLR